MKRIIVCVLMVVLMASVAQAQTPKADAKALPQIRGFTMQLNDPTGYESYIAAIDELSKMGCTWINFAVAARQKNVKAESIHIAWQNMPTQAEIEKILKYAKSKGMHTMVMPIVLLNQAGEKEWRGVIAPNDWDNWFSSYTMYIVKMAQIAQACDVDVFCVGSELLSTESFRKRWEKVIAAIKKEYKGKLTYSANWDHYTVPTFWDLVDYIGMNNYHELADKPGAPVEQLNKKWVTIKDDILDFVKKQKKPFMFTEVGWHNLQNTIPQPWNYVASAPIDPSEQLRAYQSFVETWKDVKTDQFMGAFIWEWKPGSKPDDAGTYSLQGLPALDVVKKWLTHK